MRRRGYALPLCLILATILSAAFLTFITRLEGATTTTTLAVKRRQAFYAADAVVRAAVDIASAKLTAMPSPGAELTTDAEIEAFFAAQAAVVQADLDTAKTTIAPPGFVIHTLEISELKKRELDQLDTGPFRGMLAQVQPFTIAAEVSHTATGTGAVASMRSTVQRGTLSMFQFWTFVDGYAYIYTGGGGKMAGRVHANGNICMGGGGNGLFAETVTSSEYFYTNRSSGCRREFDYHESSTLPVIATRPLTGGIDEVQACPNIGSTGTSTVNGVTYNCTGLWAAAGAGGSSTANQFDKDGSDHADGGGTPRPDDEWRSIARGRWNGQLQDRAQGVPRLSVPITGTPLMQAGRDASYAIRKNNPRVNGALMQTSRFLIDPMLPNESADVQQQKFAHKADIRILNGVWYVRDPAQPSLLGRPVWSDHPGSYRRQLGEDTMTETTSSLVVGATTPLRSDVGQADLFGSNPRPQRYSYYRTRAAAPFEYEPFGLTGDHSVGANRPVISYGVLQRDTTTSLHWVPGYMSWEPTELSGVGEWRTQRADNVRKLLHGTRSGFRDSWHQVSFYCNDANGQRDRFMDSTRVGSSTRDIDSAQLSGTTGVSCGNHTNDNNAKRSLISNMLPINFDVEAFAAALNDTTGGELGSFFSSARPFNGIVWIGSYWPGLYNGFSANPDTSLPPLYYPFQGLQNDLRQPSPVGTNTVHTDSALPIAAPSNASTAANVDGRFMVGLYDATDSALKSTNHADMRRPTSFTNTGTSHDDNDNGRRARKTIAYQSALPYPLCSDVTTDARIPVDTATDHFNNSTSAAPFIATACTRYHVRDATFEQDGVLAGNGTFASYTPPATPNPSQAGMSARPNALRVVNARHLDRTAFPRGLTIATNLPTYMLGDHNATSTPANKPADAQPITSTPSPDWRPFLIAADTLAVQSTAWEDWRAQWNSPVRTSGLRQAAQTTYHVQMLAGWLESRNGNRDETFYFTRLLENWNVNRFMRGSVVIGFASAFGGRFNWNEQSNNDHGRGAYAYDYQLDIPDNQPPGAPKFQVTATETFRRN